MQCEGNHQQNEKVTYWMGVEILPFATAAVELEGIMPSEASQTEKDKYGMLSLMYGTWKVKQMIKYNKTETASQIQRIN